MSNKIIKINSKPLEKLVAVMKKGLGINIDKSELKKDESFVEGKNDKTSNNYHPDTRIQERLIHQETKRQQNLDYINYIAGEQLDQEQTVSDDPLEEDWIKRFFNIAEDISNEEMQLLWGRILAGEIKQPKSFSLRALELLKNLSKKEAEVFTKFVELKIKSGNNTFVYNQDNGEFLEKEFGINFNDRLLLNELGLISSENNLELGFPPTGDSKMTHLLEYGKKGIAIYRNENTPKQPIKVLAFTKTGEELSKLIQPKINEKYILEICKSFKHDNIKVEYGDLHFISPGRFILKNKIEVKE